MIYILTPLIIVLVCMSIRLVAWRYPECTAWRNERSQLTWKQQKELVNRLVEMLQKSEMESDAYYVYFGECKIWMANRPYADMNIHNKDGSVIYLGAWQATRLRNAIYTKLYNDLLPTT